MRYKLDNVNIGEYLYFIIILIYDWESLGLNNKDQRKVKLYIYIGDKIRLEIPATIGVLQAVSCVDGKHVHQSRMC